ncbi:MAG: pyridoxamine 5'-phosphate oxidase family protein, partial [SAR324 cluster bacterium]|nr:pyridoxamine 5'-phosphate oxidase family protein [SAR324 cluster bacterium]
NPNAFATIVNPGTMAMYNLELEFDHSETDSDLFDDMDMKLEAIASMTGMSGIFKLLAADVYKVKSLKALGS